MGHAFPKSLRVLHRSEFLTAQRQCRRVHTAHLVLLLHDRGDAGPARLGLVTRRKVGRAVDRNRIRRVLRETFRLHRELFPLRHDVVIIAKDESGGVASAEIRGEVLAALARRRGAPQGPPQAPPA
ncbi:MAG: ribonuclease P protein component [Polyangiales bacterium]